MGKCVVLGVTGGIAAYKSLEIASRLRKRGISVYVIMTKHATEFVTKLSFESISNNPVAVDMFDRETPWEVEHIALAKRADVFVVAPATANIIAKLACGIADDMLSTTAMATQAPMLICPAMNTNMYLSAANQHNMEVLRGRGVTIFEPGVGFLAEGTHGIGRMREPSEIVPQIEELINTGADMSGKKVLVSAGPTRERIDPVRYVSNFSSGKMGYAIAERAAKRGAEVCLVSGPVALAPPAGVEVLKVESTLQMKEALVSRFAWCDIAIKAAAPADFRPAEAADRKIKKLADEGMSIELVQNPDIAAMLGAMKRPDQVLVGFAAETGQNTWSAKGKIAKKNLDFCVFNDVSQAGAGFDVDTNIASFIYPDGTQQDHPLMSKTELADKILDAALKAGRG